MDLKLLRRSIVAAVLLFGGCGDDSSADAGRDDAGNVDAAADAVASDVGPADVGLADGGTSDGGADASPDVPELPMLSAQNVLLIIADDFGVDSMSTYATDLAPARTYGTTPHLDALCDEGVQFEQAWSAPTCTPTRGTVFTGRYGFRTGLLGQDRDSSIQEDEVTLPRLLTAELPEAAHGSFGKWHLGIGADLGGLSAPNTMGWSHYSGNIARSLPAYDDWTKVVDGTEVDSMRYATTEHVDDALAFIDEAGDSRWLVWLAVNAPHTPFHLPPAELHSRDDLSGDPADVEANPRDYYLAMVEALDAEVGRLLEAVDLSETLVLFVGDNGSPAQVVEAPLTRRRAKDTLYEGGLHVPLCAHGAGVERPGRSHNALVHTVDLFATILEAFGVTPPATDSISMGPYIVGAREESIREWTFSELLDPRGYAIRDARYKLIRYEDGNEEFYDLREDPFEARDLVSSLPGDEELRGHYERLEAWAAELQE